MLTVDQVNILSTVFIRLLCSNELHYLTAANSMIYTAYYANYIIPTIVQIIVLCGRQNIALRSHHDDGPLAVHQDGTCSGQNDNIQQLLQFCVSAVSDKSLKTLQVSRQCMCR